MAFLFMLKLPANAQFVQQVELEDCREKAVQNFPISRQYQMLEESSRLKVENLNANYLPQLDLNGQATYQSDVTKVELDLPPTFNVSIPEPSKDQYKLTLDLSQVIYDGGATSKQKDLEGIKLEAGKTSVALQLYQIKERVNQIYFGIILLKKNKALLEVLKETISAKLKTIKSAAEHGTALKKDVNNLKAELLKIEQNMNNLEVEIRSRLQMLSSFTGETYQAETKFVVPEIEIDLDYSAANRLEYRILELNQEKLGQNRKLVNSKNIPRIYGFGTAGYGQPGLNMLADEFESFYMLGIKLNWNIWNWNENKKEKHILSLQQNILETEKEAFGLNLDIELQSKIAEIEKYQGMIKKDAEILELRSEIAETSSSQLDNGVITTSDYISDMNAATRAKLDLEVHRIQLIKAKIDYKSSKGEL